MLEIRRNKWGSDGGLEKADAEPQVELGHRSFGRHSKKLPYHLC